MTDRATADTLHCIYRNLGEIKHTLQSEETTCIFEGINTMILNLESFVAELRITEGTASRAASAAATSSTSKYHEAVAKNREKL